MSTEAPISAPVAPVAETPAVAPAAAPQDPQFDTRLAALSRKERAIQQQIEAFKQEKAGMVPKSELANLWKSDRAKLREYLGAAEEEWNFPAPKTDDPVSLLRSEIESMKQQAAEKEHAATVNEFKHGLSAFISQDPDAYELISEYKAQDSVFDFMVDYYKEHQVEISMKDACEYVENYLYQQLQIAAKTKKIGKLFQPSQENGKQPSPTLTGAATANPVPSTQQKRLTPEESVAAAAKLIKWT